MELPQNSQIMSYDALVDWMIIKYLLLFKRIDLLLYDFINRKMTLLLHNLVQKIIIICTKCRNLFSHCKNHLKKSPIIYRNQLTCKCSIILKTVFKWKKTNRSSVASNVKTFSAWINHQCHLIVFRFVKCWQRVCFIHFGRSIIL